MLKDVEITDIITWIISTLSLITVAFGTVFNVIKNQQRAYLEGRILDVISSLKSYLKDTSIPWKEREDKLYKLLESDAALKGYSYKKAALLCHIMLEKYFDFQDN